MSIMQAMFAGASALNNFSESMTVIGNNLANSNTTAFKSSSTSFEDVLVQTIGTAGSGNATQVGTGTGIAGVAQNMVQGSSAPSTVVTNMSIDGNGFFQVRDPSITTSSTAATATAAASTKPDVFFTRAGDFLEDKNGNLVNSAGLVLQGYKLNDAGNRGAISDIVLPGPADPIPAQATTLATVNVNLDSGAKAIDPSVPYDPNDSSTYNFETSVQVFDSQGNSHSIEVQFRKQPMNTPATVTGTKSLASQKISFDWTGTSSTAVPLVFTNVRDLNDTFTATVDPTTLGQAGPNYSVDLSTLDDGSGLSKISQDLSLGKLYTVTVGAVTTAGALPTGEATQEAGLNVSKLTGDNGLTEVTGGAENDGTWDWHAVVNQKELALTQQQGGTATAVAIASTVAAPQGATYVPGQLVFNQSGELQSEGSTPLSFSFAGAQPQQILFNFGQAVNPNPGSTFTGDSTNDFILSKASAATYNTVGPVGDNSTNTDTGSMQMAGGFATTNLEQNGYSTGTINGISIDGNGIISGSYTNSQTKKLYQIGLVEFADQGALEQKGGNLFAATQASGQPLPGVPQGSGFGSIVSNSLEQSNVDMSGEFVNMIATQRAFQANSRVITVVDSMMDELTSLKR
ncbi:MAG: flagellar hook-basal body complex protein [Magnetococcales bacterium]|nr:flagellar hook-basal body complex protein [Magnetococcales bacterium]